MYLSCFRISCCRGGVASVVYAPSSTCWRSGRATCHRWCRRRQWSSRRCLTHFVIAQSLRRLTHFSPRPGVSWPSCLIRRLSDTFVSC